MRKIAVVIAVVGLLLPRAELHAQFGGLLKKKIAEKVAEKVAEKPADKPTEKPAIVPTVSPAAVPTVPTDGQRVQPAAEQAQKTASPSPVKSVDTVEGTMAVAGPGPKEDESLVFDALLLAISAARLNQLTKGFDAELVATKRYKEQLAIALAADEAGAPAYQAKRDAYYKLVGKYGDCQANILAGLARTAPLQGVPILARMMGRMYALPEKERDQLLKVQQDHTARTIAASKAGNTALAAELRRALAQQLAGPLQMTPEDIEKGAALLETPAKPPSAQTEKDPCGAEPAILQERVTAASVLGDGEAQIDRAVSRASGLTKEAYAMMRERVIAFLTDAPLSFTKAELGILRARKAELRRYEKLLSIA